MDAAAGGSGTAEADDEFSPEGGRTSISATGSLGALDYVIRGVESLPGRKSVVFVSEGMRLFTKPQGMDTRAPIASGTRSRALQRVDPDGSARRVSASRGGAGRRHAGARIGVAVHRGPAGRQGTRGRVRHRLAGRARRRRHGQAPHRPSSSEACSPLLRDGTIVHEAAPALVATEGGSGPVRVTPIVGRLSLTPQIAPGFYILRIAITRARGGRPVLQATQWANFEVRP